MNSGVVPDRYRYSAVPFGHVWVFLTHKEDLSPEERDCPPGHRDAAFRQSWMMVQCRSPELLWTVLRWQLESAVELDVDHSGHVLERAE